MFRRPRRGTYKNPSVVISKVWYIVELNYHSPITVKREYALCLCSRIKPHCDLYLYLSTPTPTHHRHNTSIHTLQYAPLQNQVNTTLQASDPQEKKTTLRPVSHGRVEGLNKCPMGRHEATTRPTTLPGFGDPTGAAKRQGRLVGRQSCAKPKKLLLIYNATPLHGLLKPRAEGGPNRGFDMSGLVGREQAGGQRAG